MKLKAIISCLFLIVSMSCISSAQRYTYSDQYLNVTIELKEINHDSISASVLVDLVNKTDSIFIITMDPINSLRIGNSRLYLNVGFDQNLTTNTELDLGKVIHKNDSVRYEFKTAKSPNLKIDDAKFQINYLLCKDFFQPTKEQFKNNASNKYTIWTTDYFTKMQWVEFGLPISLNGL